MASTSAHRRVALSNLGVQVLSGVRLLIETFQRGPSRRLFVRDKLAPAVVVAAFVIALGARSGGYFAADWGLPMIALLLLVGFALYLAEIPRVGRRSACLVLALTSLAVWSLASAAWSPDKGAVALEFERGLLYAVLASALALVLTPARVRSAFVGVVLGSTMIALYALGTRLFPGSWGGAYDPSSGYQLAKPLGYWNALGLLAALALVLAVGLLLEARVYPRLMLAPMLVPLTVTLYFTFSRGALLALAIGLVVQLALGPDRAWRALQTVVLAIVLAIAVVVASRSPALVAAGATLQTAQAEGRRLAWELVVLALVTGAVAAALLLAEELGHNSRVRRIAGATLAGGAVVVAGTVLINAGGPAAVVDHARDSFTRSPTPTDGDLNQRLLSVSGHGRPDYWRVAWKMIEQEPALGEGAGSFERWWLELRPTPTSARNAHNLYLETLAELGPVGLALLLVVLAVPLTVVGRVRRTPLVAAAGGVYVAYLAHAAVDWDWQIVLLTFVLLLSGMSILAVSDDRRVAIALGGPRRYAGLGLVALLLVATVAVNAGNRAASSSALSLERDDPTLALREARRAARWLPWSASPAQLRGEALMLEHDDRSALASLREAVRRNPEDWSTWYDIAVLAKGGDAVAAVTRARDLNPLSVEIDELGAETRTDP
jgi:O-antigen ligase